MLKTFLPRFYFGGRATITWHQLSTHFNPVACQHVQRTSICKQTTMPAIAEVLCSVWLSFGLQRHGHEVGTWDCTFHTDDSAWEIECY